MKASFNKVTLTNTVGELDIDGAQGFELKMNSTKGYITANNVSAHFMYLIGALEGATVQGTNINIYDGDNATSCRNTTAYPPGYEGRAQYAFNKIVCDKEPGILTVETKGSEGPIINLNRVTGGEIEHYTKLGDTNMNMVACVDYSGTFRIRSEVSPFTDQDCS